MTIKMTLTENFNSTNILIDSNDTVREVLQQQEIDLTRGMWNLDGATLRADDMDRTFEDLGCGERVYLTKVTKTDNAAA